MDKITKIISLFVNETNQIEVVYEVDGTDAEGFRIKRREGRVWSPTDDISSDTLSGAHPDVKKLAAAYWSPEVVTSYSTKLIAQAQAERDKHAATTAEAEQTKLNAEAAKLASETEQAAAKAAADACEAECARLKQAEADRDAMKAKAAQEAAIEAEVAKRLEAVRVTRAVMDVA